MQGAAGAAVFGLSGCFFIGLALRLVARRGFVRGSARASRRSQRGQLESLGRSGALTAYRLARMSNQISRLQRVGQLLRDDDEAVIAEMDGNAELVQSRLEGTVVCETRTGNRGRMEHHSPFYNTFLGYSYDEKEGSDDAVVHTDHRQRFTCKDVFKEDRILHVDRAGRLQGHTTFKFEEIDGTQATARIVESGFLEEEMRRAEAAITQEDKLFARRMATLEALNKQCQARPSEQSCDDLNARIERALRALEQSTN